MSQVTGSMYVQSCPEGQHITEFSDDVSGMQAVEVGQQKVLENEQEARSARFAQLSGLTLRGMKRAIALVTGVRRMER